MSVLDCRHIDIENIWYQSMVSSVCVTEDQGAFLVLHSRKKVRQGQNWRENLGQIPNICKKSYDRCHCNKLARVLCLPLHAVWTIHIILTRILPIQKDAIGLNNGKLETCMESAPDRKTYAYLNPKYVLFYAL